MWEKRFLFSVVIFFFVSYFLPAPLIEAQSPSHISGDNFPQIIRYFKTNPSILAPLDLSSFKIVKDLVDDGGFRHVILQQIFKEIPVEGAYVFIHINPNKTIGSVQLTFKPRLVTPTGDFSGEDKNRINVLQAEATKRIDETAELLDTPQLLWDIYDNQWRLTLQGKFKSPNNPLNAKTIVIDADTGIFLRDALDVEHFTDQPLTANECLPTNFYWVNIFEKYEPEELTGACFKPDEKEKIYLQNFPYGVITWDTITGIPSSYVANDFLKLSAELTYEQIWLLNFLPSSKPLNFYTAGLILTYTQPLVAHNSLQKLLHLLKVDFNQNGYDGEGGQINLWPNFPLPPGVLGAAFPGEIYLRQPKKKSTLFDYKFYSPGHDIVVLAHEFFHMFISKNSISQSIDKCEKLTEGLCSGFGYAASDILSTDPQMPGDRPLISSYEVGAQNDCNTKNQKAAEGTVSILTNLIDGGIIENTDGGDKFYIVEPIGSHKVIYFLLKLIKFYPWNTYQTFGESLYFVCKDSIGNVLNGENKITEHDCSQITRILKLADIKIPDVGEVDLSPQLNGGVIDLEITKVAYKTTKKHPQNFCTFTYEATIQNHSSKPWDGDLTVTLSGIEDESTTSLASRKVNNFRMDPLSVKTIEITGLCDALLRSGVRGIKATISPDLDIPPYILGDKYKPELMLQAPTEFFDFKITDISLASPISMTSPKSEYVVTIKITNTGKFPILKELPMKLGAKDGKWVMFINQYDSPWYPTKTVTIVQPGQSFSITLTFLATAGEKVELSVIEPSSYELFEFVLPLFEKNPTKLVPQQDKGGIHQDSGKSWRPAVQKAF